VISAGELLEECKRVTPRAEALADVEAGIVHAAVRRLFVEPELPDGVW
jgi:hypothetical protein